MPDQNSILDMAQQWPHPVGRIAASWGTHLIAQHEPRVEWGVSLCEKWAGRVKFAPQAPMTCDECAKKLGKTRDKFDQKM